MAKAKKTDPVGKFNDAVFDACVAYVDEVFGDEAAMDEVGSVANFNVTARFGKHPLISFQRFPEAPFKYGEWFSFGSCGRG